MSAELGALPVASLASVPREGCLAPAEIDSTVEWIASCQLSNGMLPWYHGGHADPWNHMEATMALAAGGRWAEVERSFAWLAANQLADGSWCTFYLRDGVVEPRRDPNVCGYVASGAWWCWQLNRDRGFLAAVWPLVDRALAWCLRHQRPGGEMAWSVGPDGVPGDFALLAANSSLQQSLRSGFRVAEALGHDRRRWREASGEVARAVALRPGSFAPKGRWAMDWYYPVLTGALTGAEARRRLSARWREFVEQGLGTRCVADRFWVTTAETAECAMAAARAGMAADGAELLAWTGHLRAGDGSYWTGCAHPECVHFPGGQRSTYSAAAVVIADHVLGRRSPAAALFSPG
ncbi:MAG TPA: hypothetical protein VME46_15115 [Acidimicrobiales bacterium]|nr:hypothetical protein [Acidimicrobiales bacterium]